MKRGIGLLLSCLLVATLLTGCGALPDMTTEQEQMVSQYAASLLLKYDAENHSRLVDTSEFEKSYETAKRLYEEAEEAYYRQLAEEEQKRQEEASRQDELNNSYDNKNENSSSGNKGGSSDGTGGAMVVDARTIGSFLGYNDISIEYAGNDVMDIYPEDAEELAFVITSTKGNDLLVVYFNVTNTSASSVTFDVASINPTFKLSVNGNNYYSVLKTFVLEDDMSLYMGDFNPGESKRLVLITEVSEGTVVSGLGLRVSNANDSITKSLKQNE